MLKNKRCFFLFSAFKSFFFFSYSRSVSDLSIKMLFHSLLPLTVFVCSVAAAPIEKRQRQSDFQIVSGEFFACLLSHCHFRSAIMILA